MAGTLTVQNIQGPTSGANANKIIVPSGQTLDVSGGTLTPSAGQVVQIAYEKLSTPINASASSWDVITMNFTPMYSTSLLMLETSIYVGATDSGANIDLGMKIIRDGTAVTTGANASSSSGGSNV